MSIYTDDLRTTGFEILLRHLHADRDCAGEIYEEIRRRMIKYFVWNDCFPGEDLVDEVFNRVAHKLETGQVHNLTAFIWGVAKNLVREFRRQPVMVDIEDLPPGKGPRTEHPELPIIGRAEKRQQLECLQKCIQRLSEPDRELFLEYQYYAVKAQNAEALAQRLGLTLGALQAKAHRLKHKIETCALKCLDCSSTKPSNNLKTRSHGSIHLRHGRQG